MKILMLAAAPLACATMAAAADDCTCERGASGTAVTIVEADTQAGRHLTLRFDADHVTRSVRQANLCTDREGTVTEAKLWMPDMGHGSSPTRLTAVTPKCTRIERIHFLMDGGWQIKVKLSDADQGVLDFEVKP